MTKADGIRAALREHPAASNASVQEFCRKHKLGAVSNNQIFGIRAQLRNRGELHVDQPLTSKVSSTNGVVDSNDVVETVEMVKNLMARVGGPDKAKRLIDIVS